MRFDDQPGDTQSEARNEYVTIVATTMDELMQQFRVRGLGALGFTIMGEVGLHHFALAEHGSARELFDGERMLAATFCRKRQTAIPVAR